MGIPEHRESRACCQSEFVHSLWRRALIDQTFELFKLCCAGSALIGEHGFAQIRKICSWRQRRTGRRKFWALEHSNDTHAAKREKCDSQSQENDSQCTKDAPD